MTVADLKELLDTLDPNLEVVLPVGYSDRFRPLIGVGSGFAMDPSSNGSFTVLDENDASPLCEGLDVVVTLLPGARLGYSLNT